MKVDRGFHSNRLVVMLMLISLMIISILDKTIFAFAGPQIIQELELTPEQFGIVGSSFFILYSVSGVLIGFLCNRLPSRWVLSGISLLWMTAQVLTALTSSLLGLVVSRILLGIGCGPATAVTQHACFKWFSVRERILPAAMIQVAIMLGAIASALLLPLLVVNYGWRFSYFVLAMAGLLWLVFWLAYGREGLCEEANDFSMGEALPYRYLLVNKTFISITLIAFCCYLPNALLFSWLPTYLQVGLELSPLQSGYLIVFTTLGVIVINLAFSSLSQYALLRGASIHSAMVVPPIIACLIASLAFCLVGFLSHELTTTLALYVAGSIFVNVLSAYGYSIVSYVVPEGQRGSLLAIHIALLTSAGMLAPYLVGKVIMLKDESLVEGFELSIGIFGVVLLASALLGLLITNPEHTRSKLATYVRSRDSS